MPPEENQAPIMQPSADKFSQIVARLKDANNILVTVSVDPSVDQLSACIALTLMLNKQGKHATAVYSGKTPSTLGFLEPEKTLEENTNSLRDFIISLDKSKADKLRYKVEDDVVKIFITPYKTSISEDDLNFSQGDFNVDAVVALGVHEPTTIDAAVVAHGRILHDATVISINNTPGHDLGAISWTDPAASSLSEMASDLVEALDKEQIDEQIATALLTGVVSETDRFRNEKVTPHTMAVSGMLMASGASTQLVATKLEEPVEPSDEIPAVVEDDGQGEGSHNGMIEIEHVDGPSEPVDEPEQPQETEITHEEKPEEPQEAQQTDERAPENSEVESRGIVPDPIQRGAQQLPEPEQILYDSPIDPLSQAKSASDQPAEPKIMSHSDGPFEDTTNNGKTLSEIEASLTNAEQGSPVDDYMPPAPVADEGYARDAVQRAQSGTQDFLPEPQLPPAGIEQPPIVPQTEDSGTTPPPPVPPPMMPPQ